MTSEPGDRPLQNTAETSLADDLLTRSGNGTVVDAPTQTAAEPGSGPTGEDDDYLYTDGHRRSRVTTGLLIALIFVIGVLSGVLLARILTPTPPPQIVYVLNGAETPSVTPTAMATR